VTAIFASSTHVTGISEWVADHVRIPGVGDTGGSGHQKGVDDPPGRSANLQAPGAGGSDAQSGKADKAGDLDKSKSVKP
jgi:hypothetical protein